MKCILIHDFQRLPDSDCLVKYHLSHRYEKIISVLSKVVIDIVFKKHVCVNMGRIPSIKNCMKVVRLDFRRNFHLRLHTIEEKIFFKEIVTKFVRYISLARRKIENTVNVDINQALSFARPDQHEPMVLDEGTGPDTPKINLATSELPPVEQFVPRADDIENDDADNEEEKRKNDLNRFIQMNRVRGEVANLVSNRVSPTNKYMYKYPPKFSYDLGRRGDQGEEAIRPDDAADEEEQPEKNDNEEEQPEESNAQKPYEFIAIDQMPYKKGKNIHIDDLNKALTEKYSLQPQDIDKKAYSQKSNEKDEEESGNDDDIKQPIKPKDLNTEADPNKEQVYSISLNELLQSKDPAKNNIGQQLANILEEKANIKPTETKTIPLDQIQEAIPAKIDSNDKNPSLTYSTTTNPSQAIHKHKTPLGHGRSKLIKNLSTGDDGQSSESKLRREDDAKEANNKDKDKQSNSEASDSEESSNSKEEQKNNQSSQKTINGNSSQSEAKDPNNADSQLETKLPDNIQSPEEKTEFPAEKETPSQVHNREDKQPEEKEIKTSKITSLEGQGASENKEEQSEDDKNESGDQQNGWKQGGNKTTNKGLVPDRTTKENGVKITVEKSTETKDARKTHNIKEIHISIDLPKATGKSPVNPPTADDNQNVAKDVEAKPEEKTLEKQTEQKQESAVTEATVVKDKKESEETAKKDVKEVGKDDKAIKKDDKEAKKDEKAKDKDSKNANKKKDAASEDSNASIIVTTLLSLVLGLFLLWMD